MRQSHDHTGRRTPRNRPNPSARNSKETARQIGNDRHDIWRNLYELPLIETDEEQGLDDLQRSGIWAELFHDAGQVGVSSQVYSCKHVLSHRIIHARFYMVETEFAPDMTGYMKIPVERLGDYAVSRLTESFLEKLSMNYPSLF